MRDYIYQLIDPWVQQVGPFRAGFISCGVIFLSVLIICYIFQILSRKRVREIIIPGNNGSLIIAAGAISNMVQTLVTCKFKYITIKKIILWKGKRGTSMELHASYDIDGGRLPDVAEDMREEILKNLDGQLGITSVKEVIPNIKKITSQNLNPGKFK